MNERLFQKIPTPPAANENVRETMDVPLMRSMRTYVTQLEKQGLIDETRRTAYLEDMGKRPIDWALKRASSSTRVDWDDEPDFYAALSDHLYKHLRSAFMPDTKESPA